MVARIDQVTRFGPLREVARRDRLDELGGGADEQPAALPRRRGARMRDNRALDFPGNRDRWRQRTG
jgi:hypothetical protein